MTSAGTSPRLRFAMIALGVSVAAINFAELIHFSSGYLPRQILAILLWAVLPAPFLAWLGVRFARSRTAATILCTALTIALAIGLFGAWDVFLGPGKDEPLSGLIVVVGPTAQNALLFIGAAGAFLLERFRPASRRGAQ